MVSRADDALTEALSAVMDGRATPADWARVSDAWARDPALRDRWALWHTASDGLRTAELAPLRREPDALLEALHAQLPAPVASQPRGRDWWPPLAVAASFVALALGVGALRPVPATDAFVAAAAVPTPRAQGLSGLSFAQTAAGRTLPGDAPPEVIDWGLALPESAASRPLP
ncbi:MAG TPA: sigma-E factor negative regulatory protein [Roseateles sp.]|uniref:sigma-E factor negative regulatory protein n=1 Tax=Roseateles sp. TaxID=1971397 RepID=UPI002ED9E62D